MLAVRDPVEVRVQTISTLLGRQTHLEASAKRTSGQPSTVPPTVRPEPCGVTSTRSLGFVQAHHQDLQRLSCTSSIHLGVVGVESEAARAASQRRSVGMVEVPVRVRVGGSASAGDVEARVGLNQCDLEPRLLYPLPRRGAVDVLLALNPLGPR